MKEAFSKKVNELNNQINFVQNDSRKKIFELEQDFKEINRLKNVFQQQIITLINQIDN
jgi:putative IMPACT (imprinted ancient) family translation regulator